jgi:hypothetical protein
VTTSHIGLGITGHVYCSTTQYSFYLNVLRKLRFIWFVNISLGLSLVMKRCG